MKKELKIGAIVALGLVAVACGKLNERFLKPETAEVNLSDPQSVATALQNNVVTEVQLSTILAKPREFQLEVARVIGQAQGVSGEELDALVAELIRQSPAVSSREPTPASALGACSQWVEYKTVVRDPVWASSYSTFNDPTRGMEYVFYFWPSWTVNSDNIRWAASDPQVTWALWVAYGSLAGSNLCAKPHRLLIGNKGIWWAGGAERVKRSLYIHHL